jgi:hypothetical protein
MTKTEFATSINFPPEPLYARPDTGVVNHMSLFFKTPGDIQ